MSAVLHFESYVCVSDWFHPMVGARKEEPCVFVVQFFHFFCVVPSPHILVQLLHVRFADSERPFQPLLAQSACVVGDDVDGVVLVGKAGEGSVHRFFFHQIPMVGIGFPYDVLSFLPLLVLLDPFPFLLFPFGACLLAHRLFRRCAPPSPGCEDDPGPSIRPNGHRCELQPSTSDPGGSSMAKAGRWERSPVMPATASRMRRERIFANRSLKL
mmetsp:Transcript_9239/g.56171  ORF Transcript_9239/g.56171 Transcript_9239/m.56171 type:complete len:213 (+) Transcript_9239:3566-4204(+)